MAFADDDEACQVLSMLQLDAATRNVPVLACVDGEPWTIIAGEWPNLTLRPGRLASALRGEGNGVSADRCAKSAAAEC
jgi:hypothetical protein